MKLKFLITVPDKYTRETYEAGTIYEFEDARAREILQARTPVTKEPYALEYIEPIAEMEKTIEADDTSEKPKRKKKTKSDN